MIRMKFLEMNGILIEVFKDHSKTLNDSDLEEYNEELNDDDKRVQDDISSDIKRDFTTQTGLMMQKRKI